MSRWSRLVPVFVVALGLAACGGSSDTPLAPSTRAVAPRMDGGGLANGGNVTPPPPDSLTNTSTTTAVPGGGLANGGN